MELKTIARHRLGSKLQRARVQELLVFMGLPKEKVYSNRRRKMYPQRQFWKRCEKELEYILYDARKCYRAAIKKVHPDNRGSTIKAAKLNVAWARIQKLFGYRGVTLSSLLLLMGCRTQPLPVQPPQHQPPVPPLIQASNLNALRKSFSPSSMRMATIVTKPVVLAWDTVTGADSYRLCWGTQSGVYPNRVIFTNLTATIALAPSLTYYLAISALNAAGLESPLSSELVYTVPAIISMVVITVTVEGADAAAGPWKQVQLPITYTEQTTNGQRYYRASMQIAR